MGAFFALVLSTFLVFPFVKSKVEETPEVEKKEELPNVKFVKYNNPSGDKELDIFNIQTKRQVITPGIVSSDVSCIVYTEAYYYPVNNQIATAVHLLPLDKKKTPIDRVLQASIKNKIQHPIAQSNIARMQNQIIETITPIDWSYDNTKVLMKKRVGEMQRGLWQTEILVYDTDEKVLYEPSEIREAIRYYWKEKEGVNLASYRWDITPIGWSKINPDRIIVYAQGYSKLGAINLGAWSVDYKGDTTLLVSKLQRNIFTAQNGLMLKKINLDLNESIKQKEKIEESKELIEVRNKEYNYDLNDLLEIGGE